MKVIADREVCIGSGNCVLADPERFDQDDDGIVQVLRDEVAADEVEGAETAVRRCPTGALSLSE